MKARLTREVVVTRYEITADVGFLAPYPELGLLCRASAANGGRLDSEAIDSVLPGLSEHARNNLTEWCRQLDLCDETLSLTRLGTHVAETSLVPLPEQGVYVVWLAELGPELRWPIHLKRAPQTARRNASTSSMGVIEQNRVWNSIVDGELYVLKEVRRAQASSETTRCVATLQVDFDQSTVTASISGSLDESDGLAAGGSITSSILVSLPIASEPIFQRLLGPGSPLTELGRWDPGTSRLRTKPEGLTATERSEFNASRTSSIRVDMPGLGTWACTGVDDVPIGPDGQQSAQRWSESNFEEWLQQEPSCVSPTALRSAFLDQVEGTPLEDWEPSLPSNTDLRRRWRDDPDLFWKIVSPADLSPIPVASLLQELKVGEPKRPSPHTEANHFTLQFGATWPMSRLARQLLEGTRPERILLCDRYISGYSNLTALNRLVKALRDLQPGVSIDCYTGDETSDDDMAQIRIIGGGLARRFIDVGLSHRTLHDRYLILRDAEGSRTIWHLSNSLLDARTINGQERDDPDAKQTWRDLIGVKESNTIEPPGLAAWPEGATT